MTQFNSNPNQPTDNPLLEYKQETKIDSRGGIIFPAIVRKATGLDIGERAIIELKDGKLTIYRADLEEQ